MTGSLALLTLLACGGRAGGDAAAAPPVDAPDPGSEVATAPPAAPAPPAPKDYAIRRPAFRFPGGVTVVGLDPELPTEVEVSAIPDADLPPAITRTIATKDGKRRLVPVDHPTWKALTLPGRAAAAPFDVVVLWPANANAHRVDVKAATGLPETITPATLTTAIDRDGDGAPDLLWADWCCGDHTTAKAAECAAACGELWENKAGTWAIRERWGSSGTDAPAP